MWKIALLCFLGISCSDKFLEVQVEGFKSPRESFSELKILGAIIDQDFSDEFSQTLLADLKTCKNFQEVHNIKASINLSNVEPKDYKGKFEEMVETNKEARSSNGILAIDLSIKKIQKKMEKSTAFKFLDRYKTQQWYENYGIPSRTELGFSNNWEIGPSRKIVRKTIYIRYADFQYKIRYALFNRVNGNISVEGTLQTTSTLSVFSADPVVKRKAIQNSIVTGLKNRIISQVCSFSQPLPEQLYYFPNDKKVGQLINEGVELVEQGRWKLAGNKWENAIIADSRNAIAHHNLGVYYEYIGHPLKALYHYTKASRGKWAKYIKKPRLEQFLDQYQMPNLNQNLLPQIAFISSGNWVYVYGNGNKIPLKKTYSIFRIEMNRSEVDLSVQGSHLREIGSIKITRQKDGFYVGRIKTAVVDYPILPGDFVIN